MLGTIVVNNEKHVYQRTGAEFKTWNMSCKNILKKNPLVDCKSWCEIYFHDFKPELDLAELSHWQITSRYQLWNAFVKSNNLTVSQITFQKPRNLWTATQLIKITQSNFLMAMFLWIMFPSAVIGKILNGVMFCYAVSRSLFCDFLFA